MSTEVRRVPADWEHPKNEDGSFKPLYDIDYETALSEWLENHNLWLEGKHPHQLEYPEDTEDFKHYADYGGDPPDEDLYRPKWSDDQRTHYQLYETISEGKPVSPVFSTLEELERYVEDHDSALTGNN
jgi:hypothetical protein